LLWYFLHFSVYIFWIYECFFSINLSTFYLLSMALSILCTILSLYFFIWCSKISFALACAYIISPLLCYRSFWSANYFNSLLFLLAFSIFWLISKMCFSIESSGLIDLVPDFIYFVVSCSSFDCELNLLLWSDLSVSYNFRYWYFLRSS